MAKKNLLFDQFGNLTFDTIHRYREGQLSNREREEVRQFLDDVPIAEEAVNIYNESNKDKLERLQKKISEQIQDKLGGEVKSSKKSIRLKLFIVPLIVLPLLGFVFWFATNSKEPDQSEIIASQYSERKVVLFPDESQQEINAIDSILFINDSLTSRGINADCFFLQTRKPKRVKRRSRRKIAISKEEPVVTMQVKEAGAVELSSEGKEKILLK